MWGRVARSWRVLTIVCIACLTGTAASASGVGPTSVTADISLTGQGQRIPSGFFGLSVEDSEVSKYESTGVLFDRMLSILHAQDGSRMTLRLGGRSSDEAYWQVPTTNAPRNVQALDQGWLDDLSRLARRNHLRLEFDLNMAVHSPRMAASFARAAMNTVGAGHLAGFGMGNEPDLYRLESWLEKERIPSTLSSTPRHWTAGYTVKQYVQEYLQYRSAVLRAVPGASLTAPELTYPSRLWPTQLLDLGRRAPQAISFHRYATATCKRVNLHAPGVYAFLRDRYAGGLAKTLGGVARLAVERRVPLRVTEMNSVTCGGRKQLAESFATALWAPDALFEMLRTGVSGVNWHIRPKLPNAPFHLGPGGIEPLPEVYGLAVFAQMLGPRARLEETSITSPLGHELKAWAVKSRDGLRLLILNKSGKLVKTRVQVGGTGRLALVRRLLAPALSARSGVTFAGQSIGPDARWHGRSRSFSIQASGSTYDLRLAPYSAALVDFG